MIRTLNNGATVLVAGERAVVARFRGEIVVWTVDANGDAFNGRYFGRGDDSPAVMREAVAVMMTREA